MNKFCEEAFWDSNETWYSEVPDVTTCFQDIVLVAVPSSTFFLAFFLRLWILIGRSCRSPLPWTWLNTTKLVLTMAMLLSNSIWCIFIYYTMYSDDSVYPSTLLAVSSRVATYILLVCLIFLHKSIGKTTSTLLSLFWIVSAFCGIILHRSAIIQYYILKSKPTSGIIFILNMTYYPMLYLQSILSAFADKKALDSLQEENVLDEISFLCFITFSWFNKIIYKSQKQILTVSDLAFLNVRLTAQHVYKTFSNHWKLIGYTPEEKHSKSLPWALVRSFWKWIIGGIILDLLFMTIMLLPPLLLDRMVNFVHHELYMWKGYLYSCTIFAIIFIGKILQNNSMFFLVAAGGQIKSAFMSALYRKNLLIPTSARKTYSSGALVNLVSVDVERFSYFPYEVAVLIQSPIKITIIIAIMWLYIGPSCLAGVLILVVSIPICLYVMGVNEKFYQKQMTKKDLRLKYMSEIINGIKILKLYAWEVPFSKKVSEVRKEELRLVRCGHLGQVALSFIFFCAPFMVSLASFATYLLIDSKNVLDPVKAFVCLTLTDQLRYTLFEIPEAVNEFTQCTISLQRLRKFLFEDNIDPDVIGSNPEKGDALTVKNANFSWGSGSKLTLMDIDLRVRKGSLCAIIGPVGSGKTSLLSSFLGEMHKTSGSVDIKGSIAYVPQQAWILNRTLRENILLVKRLKESKYNTILNRCCLKPDLEILTSGDATEIGEKGLNLSGGQKQRISVARAVYQDKDIYLLDDPLSAVDVHVRKALFDGVISKDGLLKKKTRILVTHELSLLHKVDTIVCMKDGRIEETGSYNELMERGGSFTSFIQEYANTKTMEENLRIVPRMILKFSSLQNSQTFQEDVSPANASGYLSNIVQDRVNVNLFEERNNQKTSRSPSLLESEIFKEAVPCSDASERLSDYIRDVMTTNTTQERTRPFGRRLSIDSATSRTSFEQRMNEDTLSTGQVGDTVKESEYKLTEAENMEVGGVKARVYWEYVKNMGLPVFLFSVLGFFAFVTFETGANIWLSEWSSEGMHNKTQNFDSTSWRLTVYGLLGVSQITCIFAAGAILNWGCVKASERYHSKLLDSVLKSPMNFFDRTPMGRITNRFSTDLDIVDNAIFYTLDQWLNCLFFALSAFVVIGMNTPIFLAILLPIGIAYFFIQKLNLRTYRQLTRLESTSRSPIQSYFLESIQGVSSICAFNVQEEFIRSYENKLNGYTLCAFNAMCCERWLHFWLDSLGCSIVLATTLLAIQPEYALGPAVLGLMVAYSMTVTDALMWFVRMSTDLENKLISVERVDEYCKLEPEAPWKLKEDNNHNAWPRNGRIVFTDYSTKYAEGLDLVLKGINLLVEAGEKVGIVGRTGAGKSSITLALFRIIEPVQGSITIDDVDISHIGLKLLREKITIIPQDPVVFTGTLRMNLDPNGEYNDTDIWDSLEKSHLSGFINSLGEGLDYNLEESGANFSSGQRQLLCLARALLKKTKILVLDEATASVDMDTDSLIQKTIKDAFTNTTIITIAHRLNTILDYDKIVVMDNGGIVEVDSPKELMKNRDSTFYQMAKNAGLV